MEVASKQSAAEIESHLQRELLIQYSSARMLNDVRFDFDALGWPCFAHEGSCVRAPKTPQYAPRSPPPSSSGVSLMGPRILSFMVPFLCLEEVEARLSVVKAQEIEVKAIADEHLAREAALEKLLESLRKSDQARVVFNKILMFFGVKCV